MGLGMSEFHELFAEVTAAFEGQAGCQRKDAEMLNVLASLLRDIRGDLYAPEASRLVTELLEQIERCQAASQASAHHTMRLAALLAELQET